MGKEKDMRRIILLRALFEIVLVVIAYFGFRHYPLASSGLLITVVFLALGWSLGWFEGEHPFLDYDDTPEEDTGPQNAI